MTPWQGAAVFIAGIAAGTINTIVGSGSLVTFPTLIALGYPPLVANVSNTVGLVPGGVSGALGYRRELEGQFRRAVALGVVSVFGALLGGILLLALPESAFDEIVPALILVAVVLVVLQPTLNGWLARRHGEKDHIGAVLVGAFLCSVYGGYFGAAQGVIIMALLGIFLHDHLQRLNAVKNVSTTVVNLVAALLFVFVAHVAWLVSALLAAGSVIGGQIGAKVGRRLPPLALRVVIVVVGLVAVVKLLFFS
ncbi:MAG: sulfite exporter TauE/SafE family protein [Streptosporangiales bacterium]|nr:sulfite exporter TauE/SafE family protein [Streptosporangiales bacterium]MBO0890065.1 sulfite exporter TauE/SafE family protein [Acidothermales bacterium]